MLLVSRAILSGVFWPEAKVTGEPPVRLAFITFPLPLQVQKRLLASMAIPIGSFWPEATVTGVPPVRATFITVSLYLFVQ
jgi:hypothetical protein